MIKLNLDELKTLANNGRMLNEDFQTAVKGLNKSLTDSVTNIDSSSLAQTTTVLTTNIVDSMYSILQNLNKINEFLASQVENYYTINTGAKAQIDDLVSFVEGNMNGYLSAPDIN